MTGTSLWDPEKERVVFGRGSSFLRPHDGGYGIAPPLAGADRIEPFEVLREVRLAWIRKPIYQPLVEALVGAGYRLDDLRSPRPDGTLYLFPYDWRQDNVDSARRLVAWLDGVRLARGRDRLTVDLLCQSNGAHICRWLAKYRDLTLAEAESGAAPATRLTVGRVLLLGTSNGGALRMLREMNRGRRYVPWVGRTFRPEVFFGVRSFYQDLPHRADGLFVDADGHSVDVDLYDVASWSTYGWSIFAPDAERRVAASGRSRIFGTPPERLAFVADALDGARRFQRLLAADSPAWGDAVSVLFENRSRPTPARAVLARGPEGRWETLFPDDPELTGSPLRERLLTPGDGHATVASQRDLSPQELASLASVRAIEGDHFEAIVEPDTLATLLDALAETLVAQR
ncbi:MAG: hypothetical protein R2991_10290 [Thermoanaerobaculia bacterium]